MRNSEDVPAFIRGMPIPLEGDLSLARLAVDFA